MIESLVVFMWIDNLFVGTLLNYVPASVSLGLRNRKRIMLSVYIGSLFLAFMMVSTSGESNIPINRSDLYCMLVQLCY